MTIFYVNVIEQSYLVSRMEKKSRGHSDLIVVCDSDSNTLAGAENQASESMID